MLQKTGVRSASGILVFTDLDGTLLDHDTYRFDEALPAIRLLQSYEVPIISATSKTVEEIVPISQLLDIQHPFIAENGCVIGVPEGYFKNIPSARLCGEFHLLKLAPDYSQVVTRLASLREMHGYKFTGFSDMALEVLVTETGLTPEQAGNAKKRLCSEAIRWDDSVDRLQSFKNHLANRELQLVKGGRFWHVSGLGSKATAMRQLVELFRLNGLTNVATIGLGDSQNDVDMLQASDTAIVIRRKNGTCLQLPSNKKVYHSSKSGPAGWNETIQAVFLASIAEASH